jgi:hypothetical protein
VSVSVAPLAAGEVRAEQQLCPTFNGGCVKMRPAGHGIHLTQNWKPSKKRANYV